MSGSRSVFGSARVLALCTLLSRVTGLVRDMLLLQFFALSNVADAFSFGFQIPNLFRRLFGEGSLQAAFVPEFTRTLENHGRPQAWHMLARVLALMTVAILTVMVVVYAVLGLLALRTAGEHTPDAEASRLLLQLTGVMLPYMLMICVAALFSSVLNCVGSFGPAALLPIVLNVCMIIGIGVIGPRVSSIPATQAHVAAWSVVLAGVLQIMVLLPVLRRYGVHLGWRLDLRDPVVRRLLWLMGPVLLGQGVLVISPFIDSYLCWMLARIKGGDATATWFGVTFNMPLEAGALTAISNAQRLYQFPLGVLAISLATAALPHLTRLANAGKLEAWRRDLTHTLRMSVFLGLLCGGLMVVCGGSIVRLLFQYKNFTDEHTQRVAAVMAWYGLGLWAFSAQHIVVRGFYSVGEIATPMKLSCALLPVSAGIALALVWRPEVREAGFAVGTTTASTINVLLGLALLQRRAATRLIDGPLVAALLRMAGTTALTIFLMDRLDAMGWLTLPALPGPRWAPRVADTALRLGLGSAIFLGVSMLLGLREPWSVLGIRRRGAEPGGA